MNRILLAIFFLSVPLICMAQDKKETDFGASFAFEYQKDLSRKIGISLEEDIRLVTNNKGFDKSMTTAGIDYSLIKGRLKAGAYYSFIYTYNSDYYYEARHRYYVAVSYKHPLSDFTLSWRGRFQGTSRDESRGMYKINPKYVVRNKVDIEYTIFGSPWKPYISAEFTNTTNDPMGNELSKIRYQGGVSWRLNRTDYVEFFSRYDTYPSIKDPNVISLGIAYKIKQ